MVERYSLGGGGGAGKEGRETPTRSGRCYPKLAALEKLPPAAAVTARCGISAARPASLRGRGQQRGAAAARQQLCFLNK